MLREGSFPAMDYRGFVEGDDIGKGTVDVVVTEGFTGNIALTHEDGTSITYPNVPVGVLLSSGLDSRTVVASASRPAHSCGFR